MHVGQMLYLYGAKMKPPVLLTPDLLGKWNRVVEVYRWRKRREVFDFTENIAHVHQRAAATLRHPVIDDEHMRWAWLSDIWVGGVGLRCIRVGWVGVRCIWVGGVVLSYIWVGWVVLSYIWVGGVVLSYIWVGG